MKSRCQVARRNSPSVMKRRPAFFLLRDEVGNALVLDCLQSCGVDCACAEILARLLQLRGAKEAADDVVSIRSIVHCHCLPFGWMLARMRLGAARFRALAAAAPCFVVKYSHTLGNRKIFDSSIRHRKSLSIRSAPPIFPLGRNEAKRDDGCGGRPVAHLSAPIHAIMQVSPNERRHNRANAEPQGRLLINERIPS